MTTEQTLSPDKRSVNTSVSQSDDPVRRDIVEQIAVMAECTERPALIWGNTDRATVAAEALWVFARRVGLDGRGDDAYTAVQDLIANLMHLCEQEGITGAEVTFASLVISAEMHYQAEIDEI